MLCAARQQGRCHVFSPRRALVVLLVVIAAGAGVWVASAALTATVVYTIDEKYPAATATPVDDDCPVGVPCKAQSVVNVTDVDQPTDSVTTISPVAFLGAPGSSIPNGTLVGNTHVVMKWAATGDCSDPKLTVDKTADFLDGGTKGEVTDIACSETSDPPPLEKTDRWPTCLESDLRVKYLRDTGHTVVRRSVAVIVYKPPLLPEIRTPINLLSFIVGDGNGFGGLTMNGIYSVAVAGDPLTAPTGAMCTPMTNTGLLLGQSAAGLTLQTCVTQGRHTMTTVLTHDAAPNVVVDATVSDPVYCFVPVGGIAEYPEIAGPAGKSSSLPSGALAGAAAAGAILLVGGAWYVRRRRLS